MLYVVRSWFEKYFSDEEAVVLFLLLMGGLLAVIFLGRIMAPVIASVIVAFILQGLVTKLVKVGVNNKVAIIIALTLFNGLLFAFLFVLLPLVWRQLLELVKEIPTIFESVKSYLFLLPEQYPALFSVDSVNNVFKELTAEAAGFGQKIVSNTLQNVPAVIAIIIYIVLVPILVFFFLTDKDKIFSALGALLPTERKLMSKVWEEMDQQFANYVRGKVVEIILVGGTTYIAFVWMNLNYAALLGILVGLSVVIPYIGAAVVTIPVAMIALFQFGWGTDFFYVMFWFGIIQAIDGNILVPLLFSEVVNLHPVVIIISVLFFGGIWGLWGVFFAIPLATLVKSVLTAWPTAVDLGKT